MEEKFNPKKKILITGIVSAIIILLGSTYAFFSYSKSMSALVLTSGKVNAVFTDGTNSISFANAYPISDSYATSNLDKLQYVDFTISTETVSTTEKIAYQIYLTEESGNTLSNTFVKLYLTDSSGSVIVSPKTYSSLGYTTYQPNSTTGKLLYSGSNYGTFTKSFRLYTWLDSTYEQNTVSQTFTFKVNLYAYSE